MANQDWGTIDYCQAVDLYNRRNSTHLMLVDRLNRGMVDKYVDIALGIEDPCGNYSAAKHGLGPQILMAPDAYAQVFKLAQDLFNCLNPLQIPEIIHHASISSLAISVGSEMAMMLKPDVFWVDNVRSLWAHLAIKYQSFLKANTELKYYRLEDPTSEMTYQLWKQLYPDIGSSMQMLAKIGSQFAIAKGVQTGNLVFLWADAMADTAFNKYST